MLIERYTSRWTVYFVPVRNRVVLLTATACEEISSAVPELLPELSAARGLVSYLRQLRLHNADVAPAQKSKSSLTGTRSRFAMRSIVSNDGAFLPRSIRLRKSTETPTNSAN